jgi:endonuclease/exonuclease/phosphatase family metal-dependent hydrolase
MDMSSLTDTDLTYVGDAQKFFTYAGYYANEFARASFRSIERLTHTMPQGDSYWKEVGERIKGVVSTFFSLPLAALFLIPSFACYSLAAFLGSERFDLIQPESAAPFWQERSIKVMSLNTCFQDPWSPLTGGVVTPFEPVGDSLSRVASIVNAIAQENPAIFLGQEFENIDAQDESIRLLKEKGYHYFLRDLGSNDPIRNSSGLFVASKIPIENPQFVPYPAEDKAGLSKLSGQGALTFTVSTLNGPLRLVNVHLNYGNEAADQEARNRQLKNHVIPLLNRGPSALFGDLNFDTSKVDRAASGLGEFVNELEGRTTCTDAGKHALRGKSLQPDGKDCEDCDERIDGLIYKREEVRISDLDLKPLVYQGQLLSDHYATITNLEII